jgi:predicted RNase H-like HicB family nuclease
VIQTYSVVIHDEEGGGFWAEVEELPGCFASGATLDALEADVKAATEQHVAALRQMGEPIPDFHGGSHELNFRRWQIAVAV